MRVIFFALLVICAAAPLPGQASAGKDASRSSLAAAFQADPVDLETQRALAWHELEEVHAPDRAYQLLLVVVQRDPSDLNARKLFALACSQTGRLLQANKAYESVLAEDPTDAWMWVNFGRTLIALGEYKRARAALHHALEQQPLFPPAVESLEALRSILAPSISLSGQTFTDVYGFSSTSIALSLSSPFKENGKFAAQIANVHFAQGGKGESREDLAMQLSYRFAPGFGAELHLLGYHSGGTDLVGAGVSGNWGVFGGSVSCSYYDHVLVTPENLQMVALTLTEQVSAISFQRRIGPNLAVRGTYDIAGYSDGNLRQSGAAGLFYKWSDRHAGYVGVSYESLAFSQQKFDYFSPALFQTIRPAVSAAFAISPALFLDINASTPVVAGVPGVGYAFSLGPRISTKGITFEASYAQQSIPAATPWSGRVFRARASFAF
jgi:hypothetical protein